MTDNGFKIYVTEAIKILYWIIQDDNDHKI